MSQFQDSDFLYWSKNDGYFLELMGKRRGEDRPLREAFPAELVCGRHLFWSCEADIFSQQTWQQEEEPHVRKSGGRRTVDKSMAKSLNISNWSAVGGLAKSD